MKLGTYDRLQYVRLVYVSQKFSIYFILFFFVFLIRDLIF